MARSTKLVSAAYILAYVARHEPEQVTTDSIARALKDHPARIRQLVSALVKANLLVSLRGAAGGIVLARPAARIDFRQVYAALGEGTPLALGLREDDPGRSYPCDVHPVLSRLFDSIEHEILSRLGSVTLDRVTGTLPKRLTALTAVPRGSSRRETASSRASAPRARRSAAPAS